MFDNFIQNRRSTATREFVLSPPPHGELEAVQTHTKPRSMSLSGAKNDAMLFSERWKSAFDHRDRDALDELIDDDFVYVRHQSGKDIAKADMVNIWSAEDPRPQRREYRIVYENDEVLVSHQFIDFPSGDKESVLVVMLLRDGKLIRMETGATPMPS